MNATSTTSPEIPPRARRAGLRPIVICAALAAGLVTLLACGAWLLGFFERQEARPAAVDERPKADLKLEMATPLEANAGLVEPSFEETLGKVARAAAAKAAILDDPARRAMLESRALGDDRPAAEAAGKPARPRNWEIRFGRGMTREQYAEQLDFFGIELAVVMPGDQLLYVREFSKAKPQTRNGPASEERRYYLTWREGDLGRADVDLLARAGVDASDRVVLKIIPAAVEAKLAALEETRAGNQADKIRKTQFGVRKEGDEYLFFVMDQFRK